MPIDLPPPPDPSTPLTAYPWTIWFPLLWRKLRDTVGTLVEAVSSGSGVSLIDTSDTTASTLALKSLVPGTDITLTTTNTEIIISATGGGGGGGILPVVNGEIPPQLVYIPSDGSLVYTEVL